MEIYARWFDAFTLSQEMAAVNVDRFVIINICEHNFKNLRYTLISECDIIMIIDL